MFKTFLVFLQCRPLRHRPSACGLWPPRRHIHNGKTFTHVLSLAYMNLANSNLQSETRQQVDVLNDVIIMPSTPKNAVGLLPRAWSLLCGAAIYSASAWGSAVARSTVRAMREPICAGRVTVVSALFVIVCIYRTQQTLKTRPHHGDTRAHAFNNYETAHLHSCFGCWLHAKANMHGLCLQTAVCTRRNALPLLCFGMGTRPLYGHKHCFLALQVCVAHP